MIIDVTAEDIRNGSRQSAVYCPVANAFRRRLKESRVLVFPCPYYRVSIYREERYVKFCELPPEVETVIRLYDSTGEMKPFTFEVEACSIAQ